MAESIEGSFSFNILDNHNNLYLVKGDSPISLIHFKDEGVYVFASTKQILWKALVDSELFQDLENGKYEHIVLYEGRYSENQKVTANVKGVILIIPSHTVDIGTITVAIVILIPGMKIIMRKNISKT